MLNVTQLRVASRITKSSNYQSGTGEAEITFVVGPGDDPVEATKAARYLVVTEADEIADESLAKCPSRR